MNEAAPIAATTPFPSMRPGPCPPWAARSVCCWSISAPPTAPMPRRAPLSQGIPLRSARDREPGLCWQLALNGVILPIRPRRKARDYDKIWNQEQERMPAQDHHPRAGRKARPPCSRRAGRTSWSTGRCATAIPRSRRGSPIWWRAAATASSSSRSIRNTAPRPRRRWATRCFACSRRMRFQPALRIAAALLRRPRLYRGARLHHRCGDRAARFQA